MRHTLPIGLFAMAMLAGCQDEKTEQAEYQLLAPRDQLIRLSMDLRGTHPTEGEMYQFENSDPLAQDTLYANYADEWIADPHFIGRVKEIFNQLGYAQQCLACLHPHRAGNHFSGNDG